MTDRAERPEDELGELEARRGTDREMEGLTRIGRLPPRQKEARAVLSIRMFKRDAGIAAAAGVLERNVSELVREAALKEAREVRAGIDEARRAVLARESTPRTQSAATHLRVA